MISLLLIITLLDDVHHNGSGEHHKGEKIMNLYELALLVVDFVSDDERINNEATKIAKAKVFPELSDGEIEKHLLNDQEENDPRTREYYATIDMITTTVLQAAVLQMHLSEGKKQ